MYLNLTDEQVATILASLDVTGDHVARPDIVLAVHDAKSAIILQLREAIEKEVRGG